jgi:hypothetical protein
LVPIYALKFILLFSDVCKQSLPSGKDILEYLGVDGMIFSLTLKKQIGRS